MTVQYKKRSASSWSDTGHTGTGTSLTLNNLAEGEAYDVRVRVVTGDSRGPWTTKQARAGAQSRTMTLQTSADAVLEGERVILTATLDRPAPTGGLKVTFVSASDTAVPLVDYTISPQPPDVGQNAARVTVVEGARTATATVSALRDAESEDDETIDIRASAPGVGTSPTISIIIKNRAGGHVGDGPTRAPASHSDPPTAQIPFDTVTPGSPAAVPTGIFSDLPDTHPLAEDVKALHFDDVFEDTLRPGCGRRRFCPDKPILRWQMAVWLIRILDGTPPGRGYSSFADVSASKKWAAHVERLAERGITQGCTADRFCPEDAVTRAEMAAFLNRARSTLEYDPS